MSTTGTIKTVVDGIKKAGQFVIKHPEQMAIATETGKSIQDGISKITGKKAAKVEEEIERINEKLANAESEIAALKESLDKTEKSRQRDHQQFSYEIELLKDEFALAKKKARRRFVLLTIFLILSFAATATLAAYLYYILYLV